MTKHRNEAVQPAIAGMAEMRGIPMLDWMALQTQWAGFLMHRVEEDAALVHCLVKCSGPQDTYSIYANFFQQALADYQLEFSEIARLGRTSVSTALVQPFQQMMMLDPTGVRALWHGA